MIKKIIEHIINTIMDLVDIRPNNSSPINKIHNDSLNYSESNNYSILEM